MASEAVPAEIARVEARLALFAPEVTRSTFNGRALLFASAPPDKACLEEFSRIPSVERVVAEEAPRSVGSEASPAGLEALLPDGLSVWAGCPVVDSETICSRTAESAMSAGVSVFRSNAYASTESPYTFAGAGPPSLETLGRIREATGLRVASQVEDLQSLRLAAAVLDLIIIPGRLMGDHTLLREAGSLTSAIMLERAAWATATEFFAAAELVTTAGTGVVVLCESGITGHPDGRRLLDLSLIPLAKQELGLPVCVHPSGAASRQSEILPLALAAVAAGADAVLLDVHPEPRSALAHSTECMSLAELPDTVIHLQAVSAAIA